MLKAYRERIRGQSPNSPETRMFRLTLILLLAALIGSAAAQNFPSRPVKIVVPSSPGGATDAFSRALGGRLSEVWGQPVIVENRPGANQIIGADYVSTAPADGYTLLVSA